MRVIVVLLSMLATNSYGLQKFSTVPTYKEVNPGGSVELACVVASMKGECRWEKDGVPVGLYPGKYEMAGVEQGDCSLRILAASMEYDNGVWQCQVTASDFTQKDTLISDGAQLVVRVSPGEPEVRLEGGGRVVDRLTARAGEEINLECVSEGGNPPPLLSWRVGGSNLEATLVQEDVMLPGGTWRSISRLRLPVSRDDNGGSVECYLEHPALEVSPTTAIALEIFYPPRITVQTDLPDPLVEGGSVSLSCEVDANPPARVQWRRLGSPVGVLNTAGSSGSVVGTSSLLVLDPVRKEDGGSYQCSAENELGLAKPQAVHLNVLYAPVIVGLSPSSGPVQMQTGEWHTLRCEVRGNPVPSLQWLQQTAGGEVLVRGYEPELRLDAASYQHQGSFVCSARNTIGEVQSDPVDVIILGRPEIDNLKVKTEYIVNLGEDVAMPVEFCSKPVPRVTWNLGSAGQAGRTVELIAGSTFERFHAASNRVVAKDCFTTTLVITGTELMDSKDFELRVENEYGVETVKLRVIVVDTRLFTEEVFAAIIVGGVLTILLITIIIIYMVRIGCCCMGNGQDKKQTADLAGSDKTDLESCRSSVSNQSQHGGNHLANTVLPPDALYGTVSKKKYYEPEFNNSKEKLRPDLIRSETNSPYSTDAGMYGTLRPMDINQLYATSKKKKKPQHPEYKSQGVDCQITSSYHSNSSLDDILKAYSGGTQSHYRDNRI